MLNRLIIIKRSSEAKLLLTSKLWF
jgi:hypothetical protein